MKAIIDSINKDIEETQKHINTYELNENIHQKYVDSLHATLSNFYEQKNNLQATLFINNGKQVNMEEYNKKMSIILNQLEPAESEYNEANTVLREIEYGLSAATEYMKQLKEKKEILIAEATATEYFENLTGVKWIASSKYGKDKLVTLPFSKETATRLANLINKITEKNYAKAIKSPRGEIYRVFMNKTAVIQDSLDVTRANGFLWSQFHSFDENIAEQTFAPMSEEEEKLAETNKARSVKFK